MPTIELSNGFYSTPSNSGFIHRIVNYSDNTFPTQGLLPAATVSGVQWLYIMKGAVPTDFSTLTYNSSRNADILISYSRTAGTFIIPDVTANPMICNTTFVSASASGTATWFWSQSRNNSANTINHQFIGTVGLIGSGADLEMSDTNIVSGNPYKVNNLKIQFPLSWTY